MRKDLAWMSKKRKEKDPDEQMVYCENCGQRQRTTFGDEVVTFCKGGCGSYLAISEQFYRAIRSESSVGPIRTTPTPLQAVSSPGNRSAP